MLYAEKVSSIMFDVSCMNAQSNICDFFTKANSKHKYETWFSSSGKYYVQTSRLNLNQDSFSRFGAKRWNAIPNFVNLQRSSTIFRPRVKPVLQQIRLLRVVKNYCRNFQQNLQMLRLVPTQQSEVIPLLICCGTDLSSRCSNSN